MNKFSDFCTEIDFENMNRIVRIASVFIIPLLIMSCGGESKAQKEKKQQKQLEELALSVMEVHDRSMPDHGKLFGLKKKLLSIQTCYSTDSIVKNEIYGTIYDIEKADKDMMNWMHTYKAPDDFLPFDEKEKYYKAQKNIIERVETFTTKTIDKADQLIAKYPITESCQES
jgi:hypothetical protein